QTTGHWSTVPSGSTTGASTTGVDTTGIPISLPIIELKNEEEKIKIPDSLRIPDINDPRLRQKVTDFLRSSKGREPTRAEVETSINEYINRAKRKEQDYIRQRVKGDTKTMELAYPGVYKVKPDDFKRDDAGNIMYYEANPDYFPGSK